MFDKNGGEIKLHDNVVVDDPNIFEDNWDHSFLGHVIAINEQSNTVIVEDGDGDIFEVEPIQVIVHN